ncbi:MAG: protein kinase domain-containing protein, partial [Dolichospermum sp.]
HLLRFLLPVLSYIHSQGIIHRDISPENVILREGDSLPVLIDFGVVKELATKLQSSSPSSVTTVGKLGYAPSEQMQAGRVYPSSDLYALAVTAIVLLTGKEPGDLFDEQQLTWDWQKWVNVTPEFSQILQRMLSHKPGDRYQSATDVTQALLNVGHGNAPAP